MNYLLYCVLPSRFARITLPPEGIGGAPLTIVAPGDLAAVVSTGNSNDREPPVSDLLVYHGVIKAVHQQAPVIPFRFGCRLSGLDDVISLLSERRKEYEALLNEVGECAEMGLRILMPATERVAVERERSDGFAAAAEGAATGSAYLEARRRVYAAKETADLEIERTGRRIGSRLDGLFRCMRSESREIVEKGQTIVSLHFLVERRRIESFRAACQHLLAEEQEKILLSGPWPPFNFVHREDQDSAFDNGLDRLRSFLKTK